jgi:PBP1b-binding outer membrane lipoprotein LpoB
MKTFASILIGSVFLIGCSRQATKQPETKYETLTLNWENEIPDGDLTNHCVIIRTVTSSATNVVQTNVDSLDQAANILGQYGWGFVSTEIKNDTKSYHLQRQVREDGKTFMLVLYDSKWNK